MKHWIKLFEDDEETSLDDQADLDRHHREEAMELKIHHYCERIGLTFTLLRPIQYDEETQEMRIFPDEPEVTFDQVKNINMLGKDIKVHADFSRRDKLMITLIIK